jgi:hypothetical protein
MNAKEIKTAFFVVVAGIVVAVILFDAIQARKPKNQEPFSTPCEVLIMQGVQDGKLVARNATLLYLQRTGQISDSIELSLKHYLEVEKEIEKEFLNSGQ